MIFFISCFASITWAWFSDTATSGVISITSAKYAVAVTVLDLSNNKIEPDKNGSYALKSGDYKITMLANGTATKSSGYCRMLIGSSEYYSPRLKVENSDGSKDVNTITFNLKLHEDALISFSSSWEDYPGGDLKKINVNEVITYGNKPVINEDKKQDEDNTETDKSPGDISEDNKQDGDNSEIENPPSDTEEEKQQDVDNPEGQNTPAVIEDNKKEDSKIPEVENSQDNNKKSNDASLESPSSVTDGTKETTSVETDIP